MRLTRSFPFVAKDKRVSKRGTRSVSRRSYNIAATGRLANDWKAPPTSANAEIETALSRSRYRARELHRNSDYIRRFVNLLKMNVVGHTGFMLKNRATLKSGELDELANLKIQDAWARFCKLGNATRCGRYSMIDAYKQIVHSMAIDGEILVRFVPNKAAPCGMSLQFIEADYLDENLNKKLDNGNTVKMGVEVDEFDRAVAYWILKNHPGDKRPSMYGRLYNRVPAAEILHIFLVERPGQIRGVTWIASAADRVNMLDKFEEAALIAARVGASTMGIIYNDDGEEWGGDAKNDEDEDGEVTVEDGDVLFEAEPGVFKQLSGNKRLEAWNPDQPNMAFSDFVRGVLRGVSSGLNVSYENLSNDRENVNYSSIRQGELSDRDAYRGLQTFMMEHVADLVFAEFLYNSLATQDTRLPFSDFARWNVPSWRPRGWTWVDPDKESKAAQRDIGNMIASAEDIASARGVDVFKNIEENAAVDAAARKAGLIVPAFNIVQDAEIGGPDGKENE